MHLPFTPNHIHLISACYPPSAALLAAGQEFLPNSQELSRLTYYASNRPGKINKLSSELEKKARTDCRKAQAGNTRARATLLITLYIFKALATECRRDISLLTASLVSAVRATLAALSSDLEVAARTANVFTAWTTFTDGHLIGVDRDVTQDYLACLKSFSAMGAKRLNDAEIQNRTRLVGLAALMAAVNSEALFHSTTQFKTQVLTMMPALLASLLEVDTHLLEFEATEVKEQPNSTLLDEFRSLPALERRAASIHLHVDGDKGPSAGDVTNTSLRALSTLLAHSNGTQVSTIMTAALEYFADSGGWDKVNNCKWFAEKAAEWAQYQYRYAVPTRLVESLAESQDAPEFKPHQSTLLAMITSVFTSPVPLVNLSTSDIISSLITLTFRRISIHPEDGLLPPLVECIASLGTHVYYADQIQDLAGELISRLVLVNTNGLPGKADFERGRVQAVRCLLAGLLGLIYAADMHGGADGEEQEEDVHTTGTGPHLPPSNPSLREVHVRPSRRTRIAPQIWQDTLILLCDREYSVRADYAIALVSYLQKEIPRLDDQTDSDGVKRSRPPQEGPSEQSSAMTAMIYGDATTRFLNALHAYAYALATSSMVSVLPESSSASPERHSNGNVSTTHDESVDRDSPRSRDQGRNSTTVPVRSRKTSVILRALQNAPTRLSPTSSPTTALSDYGNVLAILIAVHENLPVRGFLTGIPMLLALDSATHIDDDVSAPNLALFRAVKQMIAKAWVTIGKVWNCQEVVTMAEQHVSAITSPESVLPSLPDLHPGSFEPPREPVRLANSASSSATLACLDTQALLISIASNQNVQEATGLDQQSLLRRLSMPWTAESAFKESLETRPNYEALRQDGLSPLIKVAPTLMHIENLSLQSLARSTRGMGVTDLREALEGRSSVSNPNLGNAAPSISTLDHIPSMLPADSPYKLSPVGSRPQGNKLAGPEVRDVLNKLGIGSKQHGNSRLKSSFPSLQKPQQLSPSFSPPYKT